MQVGHWPARVASRSSAKTLQTSSSSSAYRHQIRLLSERHADFRYHCGSRRVETAKVKRQLTRQEAGDAEAGALQQISNTEKRSLAHELLKKAGGQFKLRCPLGTVLSHAAA